MCKIVMEQRQNDKCYPSMLSSYPSFYTSILLYIHPSYTSIHLINLCIHPFSQPSIHSSIHTSSHSSIQLYILLYINPSHLSMPMLTLLGTSILLSIHPSISSIYTSNPSIIYPSIHPSTQEPDCSYDRIIENERMHLTFSSSGVDVFGGSRS